MCQSLMGLARADDVIWVHDYHLMMLPKLIKDAALKVSIVFYMHVPFPTSQIFRYVRLHIHTKHTHSPHPKYSGMFGNVPNTPFKTHLSILIQYSDTLSSHSTLPYPTLSSTPFPVVILPIVNIPISSTIVNIPCIYLPSIVIVNSDPCLRPTSCCSR